MKNTTFLIETLKRTLEELDQATLSTEEKIELTTMVEKEHFAKLFGVRAEETTQLSERDFSKLTGYQYNSISAGLDLVGNFDWVITADGAIVTREMSHHGSNHWLPPRRQFIFRLIDEGREIFNEDTRLLVIRIENTITKEVFSINFEVADIQIGHAVVRMVERYLFDYYRVSVKKL